MSNELREAMNSVILLAIAWSGRLEQKAENCPTKYNIKRANEANEAIERAQTLISAAQMEKALF